MTLGVIGFVLLLLCVKLLIACNFISKAQQLAKKRPRLRKKIRKSPENTTPMEELREMLPKPEPVYSQANVSEPLYVKKLAPPLLEASAPTKAIMAEDYLSQLYPTIATKQLSFMPELKTEIEAQNIKLSNCTGSHSVCSYVAGYGMVWEDLCPCHLEEENGARPKRKIR